MKKISKMVFLVFILLLIVIPSYFFVGRGREAKEIKWGVNFSQKHSSQLGLDWRRNYLALLDELGARNLKIAVHWDFIEGKKEKYNFADLDWQIDEAEKRKAEILLVVGVKTSRWPECHIPDWAKNLTREEQQAGIIKMIEEVVVRYRDRKNIWAWQVENEPFFSFGECPWFDKEFLAKEIALVKALDSWKRLVIISESGEGSSWLRGAWYGDIVGTTMYKKVWFKPLNQYITYPFPPIFYQRKAKLIKILFGKEVIVVELQAEPWGPVLLYDLSLEEQAETMNLQRFKNNVEFAKKTGLKQIYLWGGEWWFWLKEKQKNPEIWEEANKLFEQAKS